MRRPLEHEHLCPGRHLIAANFAILDRFTPQAIRRRKQSQAFFGDLFGIRQLRKIGHRRVSITQHLVQFRMKFLFDFRMLSQQIP